MNNAKIKNQNVIQNVKLSLKSILNFEFPF
jgi:hypothetical protein